MSIKYAIASGELDPECVRCGACIEARGILLLDHDGDAVCHDCAGPAVAQVGRALQSLYDVVVLDELTGDQTDAFIGALRHLAEVADRIETGHAKVHKHITVPADPWCTWEPAGVQVDYQITNIG